VGRFWGSQAERKQWIKLHAWNRTPPLLRPFLLFLRNYILKAGFLDGKAGFIYHVLWSFWYQFLISVKIIEQQRGEIKAPAAAMTLSDRAHGEVSGAAGGPHEDVIP
jgi:hypothetical protein